ncbi:hypothetical protein Arub01_33980 [Actinomadura rubrobrunea]|uniref:Uncharacterized protein n=1 Tax=Actinomadura rubrobrunea TaxID=115335 RepID=A0A9W6PY31_9ACTN|nr:hypothetical protein Arub01_33980 [Actinomadura rubrobrunea]
MDKPPRIIRRPAATAIRSRGPSCPSGFSFERPAAPGSQASSPPHRTWEVPGRGADRGGRGAAGAEISGRVVRSDDVGVVGGAGGSRPIRSAAGERLLIYDVKAGARRTPGRCGR